MDSKFLSTAIETFAHGFSFTRSFTHPYLVERIGPLWRLSDAPRTSGDYRTEEYIAHNLPPAQIDQLARRHTRGRFAICAILPLNESGTPMRAAFKSLHYRFRTTEPFMIHPLQKIPRFTSPATIERIATQPLADLLSKAARSRQILPEHFSEDALLRQYVALIDKKPIGWVRSISIKSATHTTWCSNMYVHPQFRRQGIARSLLSRMLHDDRIHGAATAILLASHTGAKLYPLLGYQQIATLYLFSPQK